ncbi:MAG TPA: hypothetical protein VFP21_11270 [Solirubrobacterales bacterium]|nr:hypothetical protein [Solirubrobacterales bacterium]
MEGRDAQGDHPAERVADERSPGDPERIHRLHDVLPVRHRLTFRSGVAESRQVHRHHPPARRGQRLQVLVPHPPVGDARVQQEHRGSLSEVAVREIHCGELRRSQIRSSSQG